MKSVSILLASFVSVALAQQQYSIDPSNVNITTRELWCHYQTASCPLICLQLPGSKGSSANTCDPNLLQYNCVCSNGQSPNLTQYTQTLPYFICTEWGNECVANCGSDNSCASACRQQHPCGAQDPNKGNASLVSSSASTTATTSGSSQTTGATSTTASTTAYTGLAGVTVTPTGAAAARFQPVAVEFGQAWGLGVVMAGLFGGFAIML